MLTSIVKNIGALPVMMLGITLLLILSMSLFLIRKRSGNKKITLTEEFKEAVKGIDLNLSEDTSTTNVLLEKEETLLALKELHEHNFISDDEYQMRTKKILNEVNSLAP